MNLQHIIFFTSEALNDASCDLLENLQCMDIETFWNPLLNKIPKLPEQSTLVVSDTMDGIEFAIRHHFPYIEKWKEGLASSFLKKPVCYYDAIASLHPGYLINQWKRAHHLPLLIAQTNRLILKELPAKDYAKLYAIRQMPSMGKYLPALNSLETELEKHIHYITYQYEFFDYGIWGVYDKNDILIGQAGIQNCEYQNETWLELSYLISPQFQRNGYATEAILAIYEYAVKELEQNRMVAIIANQNLASIRTAMNLGMKKREVTEHLGFPCHYYVINDIKDFLTRYKREQKRVQAAKSAYRNAMKHPVQEVYSRYRK